MLQSHSSLGTFTFIVYVLILKLIEILLITSLYNFNLSQHLHFMQNEHCKLFFTTFQTLVKHFECCHFDLIINGVNFCLPKVLFCNYNGRLHAKTCFSLYREPNNLRFFALSNVVVCARAIKLQFFPFSCRKYININSKILFLRIYRIT